MFLFHATTLLSYSQISFALYYLQKINVTGSLYILKPEYSLHFSANTNQGSYRQTKAFINNELEIPVGQSHDYMVSVLVRGESWELILKIIYSVELLHGSLINDTVEVI